MDEQRGHGQGEDRQGEDGEGCEGGEGVGRGPREDTPPAPCSAFCGPRSCATLPPSLSPPPQQGNPNPSPGRSGGEAGGGQGGSEPSKRRRLWGLRGLVKMFRRRVRRRAEESSSPQPPQPTLRARSTSELAMDVQHSRPGGGPYNQGLSVSHDSVFTPDAADHHHHHHHHSATPPSLTIATRGVNMAELKAALRQRRGEDSGSGDDDPGLPRSPPTSPTTLDVLTHGLKGSSRATQSSCSDGSLLSMGSSENDEDSLGAASHHSSRASLLEGRHQVVDHEPVAGAVRLSHQAALHKIAVRPRRTHGAPRARRATQIAGQLSLPDVIEEANNRHPSGSRPSAPQPASTPAPPPAPVSPAPPTPEDDVTMEEVVSGREQQSTPEAPPERKEERRDEPLFQRLFGSSSKRAGRRASRGGGEESRENSVSPLRRGTEQRASRDRRHDAASPRFPLMGGTSKPRQESSHPLPPSGRPRDPSKERGSREFPPASQQSPEDAMPPSGVVGAGWPQGVRKAKSFREEQAPVHREALRRKVSSSQGGGEEQGGAAPSKASRLSTSLESIDGDDARRAAPRPTPATAPTAAPATPPAGTTASPQRSSTESLTTTPLPGVFIRPYPQAGHPRVQSHPSPPEASSGPFSLDSSLNLQPREAEDPLRKASSVDQVSSVCEGAATPQREHLREQQQQQHAREQAGKEQQHTKEQQHIKDQQHTKEHMIEQHLREQHAKEQHAREQQQQQQHAKDREEHPSKPQYTPTSSTSSTKSPEARQAAMAAAKQSLLDTLVESIKPDRKADTHKATPRRSLSQTQAPQTLYKEEPPPATQPPQPTPQAPQQESGEGEREQAPPRRPLRREASVKRLAAVTPSDPSSAAVPEFMRIQLNRVESKGQSVIYDTEMDRGTRREEEEAPSRREPGPPPPSVDVPMKEASVLESEVNSKDVPAAPTPTRDITRKASIQGPRGILRDTSPSAGVPEGGGEGITEPSNQEPERVQLRRPVLADRTSPATAAAAATATPTAAAASSSSRDQPELFKVFARRSFKIKDSEKELFEATNIDDTGVEASSEVSEMMVSSVRPSSTSPRPPASSTPPTDTSQKIGINAISYNRKSVGNPALSFMPPPVSASSDTPTASQGHGRPQPAPTRTPSTTTTPPETTTTTATPPAGVYSKILSGRMSGGSDISSGNESEGSTSSPVPSRTPAASQNKPSMTPRPGSAIVWPPRPQISQEDSGPVTSSQSVTAPQETPSRRPGVGVEAREGVQDGIEVEVSPLDISAARRRFMSASFPQDRQSSMTALGTSPPALTPSPVTPSPSPPAPTPSPPAPTHPSPISSNILSRVGSINTPPTSSPITPSFTVTVRTQPPPPTASDTPTAPATAPSSDGGAGQQTAEDWRVLVRQRREGRLKQSKTPDSEEIIIETRPPVSRNSKVLEMASNFQKLQVA